MIDGYQRGLASMVYKFFDKKSKGSRNTRVANKYVSNQLLEYLNEEQFIHHLKTIFRV